MMKLSTMLKVDSTIDQNWQSPIAQHILEHWDHDPGSAHFFRSSTNFVCIFRKEGKNHFLRFADSTERTKPTIEAEIALLNFLASTGTPISTPIASKSGQYVATVETNSGTFHAVVFAELQGQEQEIEQLTPAQFTTWGSTLGKLHATMRLYQNPVLSTRGTWKNHLTLIQNHLPKDEPRIQAEYNHLASFLTTLPITPTNYGLIHGDFELDNLRWQDNTIAMLDFDDCSYYWYIADIAFALRDFFATDVNLNHPSLHAFIHGYSQHTPLDEEQLSHLPTWLRLTNLIQYAKLVRTMDLPPNQNYPD